MMIYYFADPLRNKRSIYSFLTTSYRLKVLQKYKKQINFVDLMQFIQNFFFLNSMKEILLITRFFSLNCDLFFFAEAFILIWSF